MIGLIRLIRRFYKFAGGVIGAIMAVGSYGLDAFDVVALGVPLEGWVAIGSGIFFASVLAIVLPIHIRPPGPLDQADDTIGFAESRRRLKKTLQDEASQFDTVCALLHTGLNADSQMVWETGRYKELILLDPDGKYLPLCVPALGHDLDVLQSIIRAVTRRARDAKVDVRWYDGPVPVTMTIGNPEGEGGVIRVEVPLTFSPLDARPSFYVEKNRHPELYVKLIDQYKKIWASASESRANEVEKELAVEEAAEIVKRALVPRQNTSAK